MTFKIALLAAASTDSYEKRAVLKDTKLVQKTQEHQEQEVSYTECKAEGRLRIDTPELTTSGTAARLGLLVQPNLLPVEEVNRSRNLEPSQHSGIGISAGDPGGGVAAAAPGSRTLGAIEVAERGEFSHTHHVQGLRMKIPTEYSKNIMCKPEKSYDHHTPQEKHVLTTF